MSGRGIPAPGAAHRAVLTGGKPLVYVCPPAGWALARLFDHWPVADDAFTLVLVADPADGLDLGRALRAGGRTGVHVITGLARAAALLKRPDGPRTVIATAGDAEALTGRSALKLDRVTRYVVAWPERIASAAERTTLDGLLAQLTTTRRILVTGRPEETGDLVERYARRAPVLSVLDPEAPEGATRREVRYAVRRGQDRAAVAAAVLDAVNPSTALIWDPVGGADLDAVVDQAGVSRGSGDEWDEAALMVLAELPTPALLATMPTRAEVVVLVRSGQIADLGRFTRARALPLTSELDRVRDQAAVMRRTLRETIEQHPLGPEMLVLETLLAEEDPAVVAAAALHRMSQPAATPAAPSWTRLRIDVGRRQNIRPGDLVGLLINVVGLRREDVGRVDLRDRFALVEVRPDDASRVLSGLRGQTVRGHRIAARLDTR